MKRTSEAKNILVGIYTLSHKAIEITNSNISNTTRKKLLRYSTLDKIMPYQKNIQLLGMN